MFKIYLKLEGSRRHVPPDEKKRAIVKHRKIYAVSRHHIFANDFSVEYFGIFFRLHVTDNETMSQLAHQ